MTPDNRQNCGFPGITSDECFNNGCCFDSSVRDVPWCFHPLPIQAEEQCVMEVSERTDCGFPGISPEECASRKCCFSNLVVGVPWCFFPKSVEGKWLQVGAPSGSGMSRFHPHTPAGSPSRVCACAPRCVEARVSPFPL
ncbi:Trefoil factor 2 [Lemmus lemmus]